MSIGIRGALYFILIWFFFNNPGWREMLADATKIMLNVYNGN